MNTGKQNMSTILRTPVNSLSSVLLINVAGIGDFIESVAAIRSIRAAFPRAHLSLLVSSKVFDYARHCPHVDAVHQFPVGRGRGFRFLNPRDFKILLGKLLELRARHFDAAVNFCEIDTWGGAFRMLALFSFLGLRHSYGRNTRGKGFFLEHAIDDNPVHMKNQAFYFNRLSETMTGLAPSQKTALWTMPGDTDFVARMLQEWGLGASSRIVLVNPGSDRLTRRWPPERFAAAADHFAARHSCAVVLLGSAAERQAAAAVSACMKSPAFSAAGLLTIGRLISLISRATLLITANSAPMHIAGVTGTPFVAVAGSGDPWRDKPEGNDEKMALLRNAIGCSPCYHFECPMKEPMQCMERITVEEVIAAGERMLS